MKIKYIPEGSQDCPLVLLYGKEPQTCEALAGNLRDLVTGDVERIALHEIEGFSGIKGCELFAVCGSRDVGVKRNDRGASSFDCVLTPDAWEEVLELLEPFTKAGSKTAFQYLVRCGNIDLIISTKGTW